MKIIIDWVTGKITEKIEEKKQFEYIIDKRAMFNIGIITTLNMLGEDNVELMAVTDECAELTLFMDKAQQTMIDLALKEFIEKVIVVEEPKQVKTMVWK